MKMNANKKSVHEKITMKNWSLFPLLWYSLAKRFHPMRQTRVQAYLVKKHNQWKLVEASKPKGK